MEIHWSGNQFRIHLNQKSMKIFVSQRLKNELLNKSI